MTKNNKGFVITEVLILSTVIIGLLVFMYIQFKNINRSYQKSFNYDTVEGMYLANNIVNYINDNDFDNLVQKLKEEEKNYIDITSCDIEYFSVSSFCEKLIESSNIDKILFTYENTNTIDKTDFDEDLKNYIENIYTLNSITDYRIIIKYNNESFSSMRFNKGDVYVQNGLIAQLDAINNTSNGHSNTTQTWKDLSGKGNDATLNNNPAWTSNSIIFDGQTNYATLTNTANLDLSDGVTLEARIKILSTIGATDGKINIVGNWDTYGLGIQYYTTSIFKSNMFVANSWKTINNTTLSSDQEFYTVAVTYNNNTQTLYINGEQIITETYETSSLTPSVLPFALGGDPNATSMDNYSNVEIQNVLIYDRALAQTEIQRNYQVDTIRY